MAAQQPRPSVAPPPPTAREWRVALTMFSLTVLSVFWTYGTGFGGGHGWLSPFTDTQVAIDSALFAIGLMSIFTAHELGHYVVARRHGMEQSLPLFIPLPMMIGTLGAVIRLRTPPPSRSALLEMGAAGPIAGFVVALGVMAVGLPGTIEGEMPPVELHWPPEAPGRVMLALQPVLEAIDAVLMKVWPGPLPEEGVATLPFTIMANPPVMDAMGWLMLGAPPSRYAQLSPLGFAGWVGCFLTAVNLVPIGQTDGGHIVNAIAPAWSRRVTRAVLVAAAVAGVTLWPGWIVWSGLLWAIGAARPLPVASTAAGLSRRARLTAGVALVTFGACFMPSPITVDFVPVAELEIVDQHGDPITAEQYEAYLGAGAGEPAREGAPTDPQAGD